MEDNETDLLVTPGHARQVPHWLLTDPRKCSCKGR